ncbi:hypothetical protein CWM66_12395 [Kosakonia sp. H7A]|nr:hypothetical protein CWM66_12395 [Kosakonia sp. H7A]
MSKYFTLHPVMWFRRRISMQMTARRLITYHFSAHRGMKLHNAKFRFAGEISKIKSRDLWRQFLAPLAQAALMAHTGIAPARLPA